MKLSFKVILPIMLISALLILLAGCMGTVPTDESPGYTPGTITGIIAAPCCSTSDDPVTETCCVSPEYWCYYCQGNWLLQDGIEVVLTYGEDEVATTTTNDKGEFTFTNVDPGKNYVVTAYCPDFADNRPLVKDVALQLIEGGSFDTNITDLVSTSLGLVVDFLVLYTDWGPEDISLDAVLADRPEFPNFPKFKALIYEVRRVLENCEINLLTDDDVQYATCRAAEEISGLEIGCGAGYTPPEPSPGECDGNLSPIIDSVWIDGVPVAINAVIDVVLGDSYEITVNAHDQDGKLGTLTYYASANGVESAATTSNKVTITPILPGTFTVYVYVHDGCDETFWGPVNIEVDCCPFDDPGLIINLAQTAGIELNKNRGTTTADPTYVTECMNECIAISSITINLDGFDDIVITDFLNDTSLAWTIPAGIIFTKTINGATVCLEDGASIVSPYTINVSYTDSCDNTAEASLVVTFEDCSCIAPTVEADGPYAKIVCPGTTATIYFDSTVTLGTGPFTYAWTFGDGGTSTDADPSHTYPAGAGVYNVTLVVTNDCGNPTYNTTVTVTEYAAVTADAGGPYTKTVCTKTDATIDFNGTASGTGTLTYAWDFGDGFTSDLEDPSHTYPNPFTGSPYTVTLTVTDDCGSTKDAATVTITESAVPTADAGPNRCIQLNCESEVDVDFDGSASSGTNLTYSWDFDDGSYGTGSNPSHTYTAAGSYNVTLTVTDSCGSSDKDEMDLTIHSACGNLPAQLTISDSNIATDYYLKVKFSDGSGGDILSDTLYYGWCAHSGLVGIPRAGDVMYAYCTLELDDYWPNINWIVNHRSGYSRMEVQNAIWHYIHGTSVSGNAAALVSAANSHGNFCPGIGEKYVVLLTHNAIDTYGIYRCDHDQNILIEVLRENHCCTLAD